MTIRNDPITYLPGPSAKSGGQLPAAGQAMHKTAAACWEGVPVTACPDAQPRMAGTDPAGNASVHWTPPAGKVTRDEELRWASECLSHHDPAQERALLDYIHTHYQTQALTFLEENVAWRLKSTSPDIEDFAQLAPKKLAIRCRLTDFQAARLPGTQQGGFAGFLLEQAVGYGCFPIAFKLLRGLQQLKQEDKLPPVCLRDEQGGVLPNKGFFYNEGLHYELVSGPWRQMVLAAGVFDLAAEPGPSVFRAVSQLSETTTLDALLKAGASPCWTDEAGVPPLYECVRRFDRPGGQWPQKLDKLLAAGADPHQPSSADFLKGIPCHTPLKRAITDAHSVALEKMLAWPASRINECRFTLRLVSGVTVCCSALTFAAGQFLSSTIFRNYPVEVVQRLTAAGGRLLLTDPVPAAHDCATAAGCATGQLLDLTGKVHHFVLMFRGEESAPSLSVVLLKGAIEEGRQEAARAGRQIPL